jgi:hypothetical protein
MPRSVLASSSLPRFGLPIDLFTKQTLVCGWQMSGPPKWSLPRRDLRVRLADTVSGPSHCIFLVVLTILVCLLVNEKRRNETDLLSVKSSIFWDVMPCNPLKVNRHLGGTCCLHHQGRRLTQARNQRDASSRHRILNPTLSSCDVLHSPCSVSLVSKRSRKHFVTKGHKTLIFGSERQNFLSTWSNRR